MLVRTPTNIGRKLLLSLVPLRVPYSGSVDAASPAPDLICTLVIRLYWRSFALEESGLRLSANIACSLYKPLHTDCETPDLHVASTFSTSPHFRNLRIRRLSTV
jgi:hypothetical protein